jgi:shikimate dehydrogenase
MRIDGNTEIIAHIGYPTYAFRAPLIYNPWFAKVGINAMVVPMSCQSEPYPRFLRSVFHLGNIRGALITMPHKVTTVGMLDDVLPTAMIAGSCNAVRRMPDGRLQGNMFDGEGFVRGLKRKGFEPKGRRALVVGAGGVGCAIAASLAAAGVLEMDLFDM